MIDIKFNNSVILSVQEDSNSLRSATLMNTDQCRIEFELAEKHDLPAMSYIEHQGQKFYLEDSYSPESEGEHYHKYSITFVAYWCISKNKLFKRYTPSGQEEIDFAYDGTISKLGELFVSSLNKALPLQVWTLGECPQGGAMEYFTFDSIDIFSAISQVSSRFKLEGWFEGSTLNFGKYEKGTLIELSTDIFEVNGQYMSKLARLTKDKTNDVQPQFLYAYGGTKNIVRETDPDGQSYYNRVQLPVPYIEVEGATSGKEVSVKYDDIFPRIEGTIDEVTSKTDGENVIYYVKDNERGFVLKNVLVAGKIPRITFITGRLAGREFNIQDTSATQTQLNGVMEIFREEQEGVLLPNLNTRPEAGDKYTIYNILLPKEKEVEAQQELLARATIDAELLAGFSPQSTCDSNEIYFSENNITLSIGQRVKLYDSTFKGGSTETRVIDISYKFESPHLITFKTASSISVGSISNLQSKLNEIGSNLRLISEGEQYHPLRGRSNLPMSGSNFQMAELKSYDYTGAGFEKGGFAVIPHPDRPNENLAIFDNLNVRKTFNVYEIVSNQVKHMGGKIIFSATDLEVSEVENLGNWQLYFDTKDSQVKNQWVVGDIALCQKFDPLNVQTKYYRKLVIGVGENYIEIDKGGATPSVGDYLVQHGHVSNKERQSILVIDTIGGARFSSIQGLTDTNAVGQVVGEMGWIDGRPKFFIGDKTSNFINFDGASKVLEIVSNKITFTAPSGETTLEDWATEVESNSNSIIADYNAKIALVQEQLDNQVSNWFYPYSPTLNNFPANSWLTEQEKENHIGDTFTNIQDFVDDTTTPDAGKSWRWIKDNGSFMWRVIANSDATKALLLASKAQATADGKSTTYFAKPTKYSYGDMWVLESGTVHSPNKQGEILFASKTAEFYTASDWVTKVRYTDDTVANDAKNKAELANAKLADIASDNKLTPDEKQATLKEWEMIKIEYPKIVAQAELYGVVFDIYEEAYIDLNNYITPLLENLNTTDDITGNTFRFAFRYYYDERQTLLNAISAKTKQSLDNVSSEISQMPDKISLAVNSIEVGGTNYIKFSGEEINSWTDYPALLSDRPTTLTVNKSVAKNDLTVPIKYFSKKQITMSFEYEYTEYKGGGGYFGFEIYLVGLGGQVHYKNLAKYFGELSPASEKGRIYQTFDVEENVSEIITTYTFFNADAKMRIFNRQIEIGNKVTDWKDASQTLVDKLKRTAIDIERNVITAQTDQFRIISTEGNEIAVFEERNGVPLLKAENIDTDNLTAKKLQTSNVGKRVVINEDNTITMFDANNEVGLVISMDDIGSLGSSSSDIVYIDARQFELDLSPTNLFTHTLATFNVLSERNTVKIPPIRFTLNREPSPLQGVTEVEVSINNTIIKGGILKTDESTLTFNLDERWLSLPRGTNTMKVRVKLAEKEAGRFTGILNVGAGALEIVYSDKVSQLSKGQLRISQSGTQFIQFTNEGFVMRMGNAQTRFTENGLEAFIGGIWRKYLTQ